tara:strand:- start:383 stop:607 length:225 start_codon:yes stop_codon:yes gene_type:complete
MNINNPDTAVNLENRQLFNISYQERQRLRKIVRKVHLRFLPESSITDKECDKVIESLGPQIREKLLVDHLDKVK